MSAHGAVRTSTKTRGWPVTTEARAHLVDAIVRMREELAALTGQGLEEGIVRLPVALASRRLEMLEDVLAGCEVADGVTCAIGRRATLRDDDGESMAYDIVLPGDGEPSQGRISADSPLGAAILGARPGDVIEVLAPAGRWSATVVAID